MQNTKILTKHLKKPLNACVIANMYPTWLILSIIVFPFLNTGITNYEEYSLIQEMVEEKREEGMGTLKKDRTLLRDERKMEKLKAKLHTDDDREFSRIVFDLFFLALC